MTDTTTNTQYVRDLIGRQAIDGAGDKVGTINDVYLDQETGEPEWLAISTGLFGTKISFVPIGGIGMDDEDVVIAFDKAMVKDAPRAEADGQLSDAEERDLYGYYGRNYSAGAVADTTTATVGTADVVAPVAPAVAGRTDGDARMTRSEEELTIDKHQREAGRVKLRKWVETENVQVTVPVKRQMARIVREPVDASNARIGDIDLNETEEEVVLYEEQIDVSKNVVAKEKIGLETYTETDEVVVDENVRKERVEIDGDTEGTRTSR